MCHQQQQITVLWLYHLISITPNSARYVFILNLGHAQISSRATYYFVYIIFSNHKLSTQASYLVREEIGESQLKI